MPRNLLPIYREALGRYLERGAASDLETARDLGFRAVSRGLQPLHLANIHEEALDTLVIPDNPERNSESIVRRAGEFFAEAIMPMEEAQREADEAHRQLKLIIETLTRRTVELTASNKELEEEIAQRKAIEESLRISESTTSRLLIKSRQLQEDLRNLSRRLLTVQEEERRRISRELHDVIAQALTGINLHLATLKAQHISNEKQLHRRISATQRMVKKSVDAVHRFARDLRPALLDDLGLIPALRSHIKSFTEQTGIAVEIKAFAGVEELDGEARTALYRVVQEALSNVAQHAEASRAEITIRKCDGGVRMEISDDGKGFVVDGSSTGGYSERLGLLGMQERMEMVGGSFSVTSAPGEKTTVSVDVPLEHAGSTLQENAPRDHFATNKSP